MENYCSNKEIIKIIEDYIKDSNTDYAIMLNGKWGSGKTYFMKEKVIRERFNNSKQFIYISVYGITRREELDEIIYNAIIESNLPKMVKNIYSLAKKGIISIYDIVRNFKPLPEIPTGSIKSIMEIIQETSENNFIFIFDDIERCNMPINELFGYINEFVEQRSIKTILIANEEEILKMQTNLDKSDKNQQNDSKEGSDLEENVFSSNEKLYKIIKEKLIGRTIYFYSDLDEVLNQLTDNILTNYKTRQFVKSQFDIIKDILYDEEYCNIRTIKFALSIINKVFLIINKTDFDQIDEQNIIGFKNIILTAIIEYSILYKNGKSCEIQMNKYKEFENIKIKPNKEVWLLKCINLYIETGYFNNEYIKKVLEDFLKFSIKNIMGNDNPYVKLCSYLKLEDEEIIDNIAKLKVKLEKDEYEIQIYDDIITTLVKAGNIIEINPECIDEITNIMLKNIESCDESFENDYFINKINYNGADKNECNKYINRLNDAINQKNLKSGKSKINQILDEKDWGERLYNYCYKNQNKFLSDREFFKLIDVDKLLGNIEGSSSKDIYELRHTLDRIYNKMYASEFYIKDIENLENFLELLEVNNSKNYSKVKIHNLNLLKDELKIIIEKNKIKKD